VLPITFRFRGGRGVATAGGVLAVIYPLIALGLALLWFVIARGFKKASVASIVITVAFPVLVAVTGNSWGDILITSGLALVILARHVPNLRRLLRGEEHGLGREPPGGSVSE
jgi:acyl phosphate:glycerol-3-phosphate acyltransferase